MASFWKRDKLNGTDAQSYLRATNRVSRPMALVLGLVGLLAAFAIGYGLFVGGRWALNELRSPDTETNQAAETTGTDPGPPAANEPTGSQADNPLSDSNNGQTPAADPEPTSQPGITVTPEVSEIPRTGAQDTVLLAVLVAVVSSAGYRGWLLAKEHL